MKVLLAHNGSAFCQNAVSSLCRAGLPEIAEAVIVYASPDGGTAPEFPGRQIASAFPLWKIRSEGLRGTPVDVILNMSGWWRPDLLIIGADTFPRERSMASNVSLEVAHRAGCSVRIVRCTEPPKGAIQVVIANSGLDEYSAVMNRVEQRNWPGATEAHVVSVAEGVDELLRQAGHCKADTVFVAAQSGSEPQRFLLGSVATAVVTRARSTVEVVRT